MSSQRRGAPFLWGVISLALSLWSFGLFACFSAENALFWASLLNYIALFFPLLVLFVLGHSIQLILSARSGQGRHAKLKSTYLLVAIVIGIVVAGSTLPLEFGINIPPYGIFCVAIMNVMFTYAMLKHDLLDIPETISVIIARLMTYLSIFFLMVLVLHLDIFTQSLSFTQSQLVFWVCC